MEPTQETEVVTPFPVAVKDATNFRSADRAYEGLRETYQFVTWETTTDDYSSSTDKKQSSFWRSQRIKQREPCGFSLLLH
jgi:hypothetical protein